MKTVDDVPKCHRITCYAVATDKFMSGWGEARGTGGGFGMGRGDGKSYYAVACHSSEEAENVMERMGHRSDFIRVRFNLGLPRGRAGDHLHVVPFAQFRYQPNYQEGA